MKKSLIGIIVAVAVAAFPQVASAANYNCMVTRTLAPFSPVNTIDTAHLPDTTMPSDIWGFHTGGASWAVGAWYPGLGTFSSTAGGANPLYHTNPYPGISAKCRTENKDVINRDGSTWYVK